MIKDNFESYGFITRFLHWTMALGFLFILFTMIMWNFFPDYPLSKSLMPHHKSIGFILFVMAIFRIIWFFINKNKRPPELLSAKLGQWAMLALMFIVPLVALLRQYGAARGALMVFGIEVMPKAAEKIGFLVEIGNLLHKNLGIVLFILIFGHIFMVFIHDVFLGDSYMKRIWGKGK